MNFSPSLGLETEPFKNWDNILLQNNGPCISEDNLENRSYGKRSIKWRKSQCKDNLFLMEKTIFY